MKNEFKVREIIGMLYSDETSKWRKNILSTFEYKCFKCSSDKNLEIDHHNPVFYGFTLSKENAVLLCSLCNSIKSSSSPRSLYNEKEIYFLEKNYGVITANSYYSQTPFLILNLYKKYGHDHKLLKKELESKNLINNYRKNQKIFIGELKHKKAYSNSNNIKEKIDHLKYLSEIDPSNKFLKSKLEVNLDVYAYLYGKEFEASRKWESSKKEHPIMAFFIDIIYYSTYPFINVFKKVFKFLFK